MHMMISLHLLLCQTPGYKRDGHIKAYEGLLLQPAHAFQLELLHNDIGAKHQPTEIIQTVLLILCLQKVTPKSKTVHKKGPNQGSNPPPYSEAKVECFRHYYSRCIQSLQMAVIYFLYRGSGISLQPDYRVDL
jgi:hypothetical protein